MIESRMTPAQVAQGLRIGHRKAWRRLVCTVNWMLLRFRSAMTRPRAGEADVQRYLLPEDQIAEPERATSVRVLRRRFLVDISLQGDERVLAGRREPAMSER